MVDLLEHAGQLRTLFALNRATDASESERTQRPAVPGALSDDASGLRDAHTSHQTGASVVLAGERGGSTSAIDLPRMRATSSGRRRLLSAFTVALAMLIGLVVPRLLARMSWIPASSSTARTPPPAMTPVPSLAGLSITRAASNSPIVPCVIVVLCLGTVKMFFLASSAALVIASGTSRAFP